MPLKSDYLQDEICQERPACTHPFKDPDSLSPSKIRANDDKNHANSETSMLQSVCSSHDSSCENAESMAALKVSDASEGMSMLSNIAVNHAAAGIGLFLKSQPCCANRCPLSNIEIQKISENNGDDLSCISGPQSSSISDDHGPDICRNASFSAVSHGSSLPGQLEKNGDVQPASCCQANNFEEQVGKHNCFCRPTKFTKELLLWAPHFPGKSVSTVSSMKGVDTSGGSLKGHLSKYFREQEESSAAGASITQDIVEYDRPATEADQGDLAIAVEKHVDWSEDLVVPGKVNVQGPPEQSHFVECNHELNHLEDVIVCDICGDVGRKDSLATCSKCSDGAEHIYCMRDKMEKVPEGDWMCEDCVLQEDTDTRSEIQKLVNAPQGPSSNETRLDTKSSDTNIRSCLELGSEDSCVEKSGLDEVYPIPHPKRPADSFKSDPIMKRRALETSVGSSKMSSSCREVISSHGPPYEKSLDTIKVKPTCHASNSGDQFFICSQKCASPSRICASSSPKSLARPQRPQDSKQKLQASGEDILEKQKFSFEAAVIDKGRHEIVGRMSKSVSFNSARSGHFQGADLKIETFSSNTSPGKDTKSYLHVKESNMSQRNCKAKSDNPSVSSLTVNSSQSVPRIDENVELQSKTKLLHSVGNEYILKPCQSHENSNISSRPAHQIANEASNNLNSDQAVSGVAKKLYSHSSTRVGDPHILTKCNSPRELKQNVLNSKDGLKSGASLSVGGHFNSSSSVVQNMISPSTASCNQLEEAKTDPCSSSAKGNTSGISKEPNASLDKDHGPPFCDQTAMSSIFAIPKHDYIWKGGFKIKGSGRLPGLCDGIQAHLSRCASPKVHEVVKKFPCKILLEEVTQSSLWPIQFLENHPKEDIIGVYFFAEDQMSYEQNYRSLTECMIKYELALKGDINGVPLLIFSSNLLPKNSQRWNRLSFLWGVLRGKKINNEDCLDRSMQKSSGPSFLSNTCSGQSLSTSGSSGINIFSYAPSKDGLYAQQSYSSVDCQQWPLVSCGSSHENYELHPSAYERPHDHLQMKFHQKSSTYNAVSLRIPMQKQLYGDVQQAVTSLKEPDFLDLGLSLGVGMKYKKQALPSHFLKDRTSNSIASNKANGDGDGDPDDKISASVELSLALPSVELSLALPSCNTRANPEA
ncbi:hypothetical protein NMG60_11027540 [Bertholletia excelsa]